jgi:hypothetical protein
MRRGVFGVGLRRKILSLNKNKSKGEVFALKA